MFVADSKRFAPRIALSPTPPFFGFSPSRAPQKAAVTQPNRFEFLRNIFSLVSPPLSLPPSTTALPCARQTFFAEQAEAGWPDLRRSLSVAGRGGGDGLAALVTAHSRYISRMHRCMFLGADRQGALARARIGGFYEVVCAVARVTDGLLLSTPSSPWSATTRKQQQQQLSNGTGEMVLPDGAFAELVVAREKFDAARRGLCGALSEICAAGGGARARPLLETVGYGGYGDQDVAAFDDVSP